MINVYVYRFVHASWTGKDEKNMKKSKLILTLAAAMLLVFVLALTAGAETRRLGDVDADKAITAADARLALRAAVELENLQGMDRAAANVDKDDAITAADARLILRAAVELETIEETLHTHEPGAPVKENEVAPDCVNAGSYDAVVYCRDPECPNEKKVISSSRESVPALGHDPAAPVKENEVAPTCLEDGSYDAVVYCKREGCPAKERSREKTAVPALGHDPKFSEEKSTFSLVGESTIIYTCARCGKDGTTDEGLKKAWTFSGELNEENVAILNHYLNTVKDGSNTFSGFKTVDNTAVPRNESFNMSDLMKWIIERTGEDTADMPTDLDSFKRLLRDSMGDLNESKVLFYFRWGIPAEKESFNIINNDAVSLLTKADLKSLTVERVNGYDFTGSLRPEYTNAYYLQYFTNSSGQKTFFDYSAVRDPSVYGYPKVYNTQEAFIDALNPCGDIVKITIGLKDESYDKNSINDIVNKSALSHIITLSGEDFDFSSIGDSLGMSEEDEMIDSTAETSANTKGTVTYYFDAATEKPLAAVYDTNIKTTCKFTMSMELTIEKMVSSLDSGSRTAFYVAFPWAYAIRKQPLAALSMGATVDLNQALREYYVFNPSI